MCGGGQLTCTVASEIAPRRKGDPPILIGDATRARAVLGWQPKRSELTVQIAGAWKWMNVQSEDLPNS